MRGIELQGSGSNVLGLDFDRRWMPINALTGNFLTQRELEILATFKTSVTEGGLIVIQPTDNEEIRLPNNPKYTVTAKMFGGSEVPTRGIELLGHTDHEVNIAITRALNTNARRERDEQSIMLVNTDPNNPRIKKSDRLKAEGYSNHKFPTSLADGYPISLGNRATLRFLNEYLKEKSKNPISISRFRLNFITEGFEPWEEFQWKYIFIGDNVYRVAGGIQRCKITTIRQTTGEVPDKTEPTHSLSQINRDLNLIEKKGKYQLPWFGIYLVPEEINRPTNLGDELRVEYW